MPDVALACPACRAELDAGLVCAACGRAYVRDGSIPLLVANDNPHAAAQAAWFSDAVDPEWEITRPHGAPRFHRWLLEEKFRRSVAGLELHGSTALVVCAGSGMDAELLARAGARVVAADISPGGAARIAERASRFGVVIEPMVADVERLPFANASFDVVYVHDGLHHLEDPMRGLDEMTRVARRAVSVTEPAAATATRLAARLGLAAEREDAGNAVARLALKDVSSRLREHGFEPVHATRYGMLYRHEPGWPSRLLSLRLTFPLARGAIRSLNTVAGRLGNKLVVVGVRR